MAKLCSLGLILGFCSGCIVTVILYTDQKMGQRLAARACTTALQQVPGEAESEPFFDLVFSAKVVKLRKAKSRMRYDRLEVFKWSIRSYANLTSLRRAFLFVELDKDYAAEKPQVEAFLRALLGERLALLEFSRVSSKSKWQDVFSKHFQDYDDEDIIWFLQNDDHPWVDMDESVWKEGLRRMKDDPSQYKSLYPSHWPEVMKLSGKIGERVEVCGSYIRTTMTLLDAVQVMNFAWFRHLLTEVRWKINHTRIDFMFMDSRIWSGKPKTCPGAFLGSYQTIYIPLREICRKFDGYQAQNIPPQDVPWLVLPPEANVFDRSPDALRRLMTSVKSGRGAQWAKGNEFKIPELFIDRALSLYQNQSVQSRCLVVWPR